jgi:hypothetical protein
VFRLVENTCVIIQNIIYLEEYLLVSIVNRDEREGPYCVEMASRSTWNETEDFVYKQVDHQVDRRALLNLNNLIHHQRTNEAR